MDSRSKGKIIFVVGGVMSGIGKGIIVSSIASILIDCGLKVNTIKLDPYLNVDAGTINPFEHGETYVTKDGLEADLDLGHYERFTNCKTTKNSIITSGKIYQNIIQKERRGEYLGSTVQMIPHVSNEIIHFINLDVEKYDITLCEIGGTVGDIESMVHMEAIRQIKGSLPTNDCLILFLTYIPFLQITDEFKTKPAQDSIKTLLQTGLQPDMIICRYENISVENTQFTKKISLYSNVHHSKIFLAPNIDNIYKLPYIYSKQGIHKQILDSLCITNYNTELYNINKIYGILENLDDTININLVVKYGYADAYLSLIEALKHAAYSINKNIKINWIDVRDITGEEIVRLLRENAYAILIPGGFGVSGVENKIRALHYARTENIPCLGICYGMQLMAIEYARNVVGLRDATSEELDPQSTTHIVHIINRDETNVGGTMRLGDYKGVVVVVKNGTNAEKIYGDGGFEERHRHRYEINTEYKELLENHGFIFSGISEDGNYIEIGEVPSLDFYMGVQFHPEFNTCIFRPNKIIVEFVKKSYEYQCRVLGHYCDRIPK